MEVPTSLKQQSEALTRTYTGQIVACSECHHVQYCNGLACTACGSQWFETAWPFADLTLLVEDAVCRAPSEFSHEYLLAELQLERESLLAGDPHGRQCRAPWQYPVCEDAPGACEDCVWFQA